eukprot:SM007042S21252  [mRNA]  locus=s7042:237:785:+ [translate_table: standard]
MITNNNDTRFSIPSSQQPPVAYHEAAHLDTERELEADEAAQVEAALQASLQDPRRAPPAAAPDASRSG